MKTTLLLMMLISWLSAENFDKFLKKAIDNSPYLNASALAVKQSKEQGSALKRYQNPSVELQYSEFDPNIGDKDNGYRVSLSQPIRLWGVGDDKDAVAMTLSSKADAQNTLNRASFIKAISLQFCEYAQQKMLTVLGKEELEIAKKIYDISKARYESGTISRGVMLQAKVDYEMILINNESLNLQSTQAYYALLKQAGVNEEMMLETDYDFHLRTSDTSNPELTLLEKEQKLSLNEAQLNTNSVEWVNMVLEYENEPDQDILRAGVNFPIAVFNTKSQEREIAKLQASRAELTLENETNRLAIDTKRAQLERHSLEKLQKKNENILSTELELLTMFQEGYEIANVNLLQLQDIKNKVITTKKSLIQIRTALNNNAIIMNYNQGSYNE